MQHFLCCVPHTRLCARGNLKTEARNTTLGPNNLISRSFFLTKCGACDIVLASRTFSCPISHGTANLVACKNTRVSALFQEGFVTSDSESEIGPPHP